jgi:hypothetical protein
MSNPSIIQTNTRSIVKERDMRNRWKGILFGLATLLIVGGSSPAHAAICGDLNNNGSVNTGDATLLLQAIAGTHSNPASLCGGMGALQCGDLNASGSLSVADGVILLRVLNELPTLFPPCTGTGNPFACGATVSGNITTNRLVQKCAGCEQSCSIIVDGTTFVTAGVTLSFEAGATVCGKKGAATPSTLVFLRDAKINAPGTPCNPIIMTSDQPEGSKLIGDWGGVVFNGRAPVNCGVGACFSEGLSGVEFGGNNPNDSSGLMRFVRIEFSGVELSPDNELNVLTLNGVGRGSDFTRVQTHMGFDDGFEWFGGTVRSKYLVATASGDDLLDWQIGYAGANQFGLALQRAASMSGSGRNGYESDNNENGENFLPRSNPEFCNFTVIGAKGQGDATAGRLGGLLRRGTAGTLANHIIMDFPGGGVQLADANTAAQACGGSAGNRPLSIRNTLFFNNGATGTTQATGTGDGAGCTGALWYNNILAPEFSVIPATATSAGPNPGITTGAFPTSITTQFIPPSGANVSAPDCKPIENDFFDVAAYKGGFLPGGTSADNWISTCPATPQCEWVTFDTN